MGLCGSGQGCGCSIRTLPATAGAINGTYPTVGVNGGGGFDNRWQVAIDENWTILVGRAASVTPWVSLSLGWGWDNYHPSWQAAQFRKIGDIVYLRGLLKNTDILVQGAWPGSVLGYLPEGFRPPSDLIMVSDANPNMHTRVDLRVDGTVNAIWPSGANPAYYGISGIEFSTTA